MTPAEQELLQLSDTLHDWGHRKLFDSENRTTLEVNIRLNYITAKVRGVQADYKVPHDSPVFSQLIRSLLRFSKLADVGYIYGLAKEHDMSDWSSRAEMWKKRLEVILACDDEKRKIVSLEDLDRVIANEEKPGRDTETCSE